MPTCPLPDVGYIYTFRIVSLEAVSKALTGGSICPQPDLGLQQRRMAPSSCLDHEDVTDRACRLHPSTLAGVAVLLCLCVVGGLFRATLSALRSPRSIRALSLQRCRLAGRCSSVMLSSQSARMLCRITSCAQHSCGMSALDLMLAKTTLHST